MRIAFVALSAPGRLNPTKALARRLQSRNHEVVLISLPDAEPYVRAVELIPISLGLRYVHVFSALHFDYSGYTPLCVYDLAARDDPSRADQEPKRRS